MATNTVSGRRPKIGNLDLDITQLEIVICAHMFGTYPNKVFNKDVARVYLGDDPRCFNRRKLEVPNCLVTEVIYRSN